jgi:hypothetical protein
LNDAALPDQEIDSRGLAGTRAATLLATWAGAIGEFEQSVDVATLSVRG